VRFDLSTIELLALDVDGVLTDGGLVYSGSDVAVRFNAKDGSGIMHLVEEGITVSLISFRDFPAVRRRARDLGISHLCLGCRDKAQTLRRLCSELSIDLQRAVFMGDDARDVPAMEIAGFSACPSDAHPLALRAADFVASRPGGQGAVRELIDLVREARDA
jgi:3-deoxy-D-manno-octulosonate 8-phosphate phosphatase (KDO 8-P phosphatase)